MDRVISKEDEEFVAKELEAEFPNNPEAQALYMFAFKLQYLLNIDVDTMEKIGNEYCDAIGQRRVSDALIAVIKHALNK